VQSGLGRPLFATQSCSAFPERLLSSACTSWKKIMRREDEFGDQEEISFFLLFFFFLFRIYNSRASSEAA